MPFTKSIYFLKKWRNRHESKTACFHYQHRCDFRYRVWFNLQGSVPLPDYWNRDGISHHGDVKPAGQAAKSKLNKNPGPHLDLDEVIE
jgi:hypothetical protein